MRCYLLCFGDRAIPSSSLPWRTIATEHWDLISSWHKIPTNSSFVSLHTHGPIHHLPHKHCPLNCDLLRLVHQLKLNWDFVTFVVATDVGCAATALLLLFLSLPFPFFPHSRFIRSTTDWPFALAFIYYFVVSLLSCLWQQEMHRYQCLCSVNFLKPAIKRAAISVSHSLEHIF